MILSKKRITKVLISLPDALAGLRFCGSKAQKTGFLPSRPNFRDVTGGIFHVTCVNSFEIYETSFRGGKS